MEMVFEDNDDCRTTYLSADDGWNTFKFHDYIDDEGFYDRALDEKDIKYNFDIDNDKYNIEK